MTMIGLLTLVGLPFAILVVPLWSSNYKRAAVVCLTATFLAWGGRATLKDYREGQMQRELNTYREATPGQTFVAWQKKTTTAIDNLRPGDVVQVREDWLNPDKVKTLVYEEMTDGVYRLRDRQTGKEEIYSPESMFYCLDKVVQSG